DILNISTPPVRHQSLTTQMKARLKLIYAAINEVDSRNYSKYEEDFRRSINIDREIIITELLTAAYLDCVSVREMTEIEKKLIYALTLMLGNEAQKFPFKKKELNVFVNIIKGYLKNIDAEVVMEYKFKDKTK